jgi:hypothetical protein
MRKSDFFLAKFGMSFSSEGWKQKEAKTILLKNIKI